MAHGSVRMQSRSGADVVRSGPDVARLQLAPVLLWSGAGPLQVRPSSVRSPCAPLSHCRDDDFWPEIIGPVTSIEPILNALVSAEIGGLPPVSQALRAPSIRRLMNTTAHDFVTVDMRGLKAALVARAQARAGQRVGAGSRAVARALGLSDAGGALPRRRARWPAVSDRSSCRSGLTSAEARLARGRRARRRPVARRLPGRPRCQRARAVRRRRPDRAHCHTDGFQRRTVDPQPKHPPPDVAAAPGRGGTGEAYREMLDTLADDVRRHLELAARVLADLQPRGRSKALPARPSSDLDDETRRDPGQVASGRLTVVQSDSAAGMPTVRLGESRNCDRDDGSLPRICSIPPTTRRSWRRSKVVGRRLKLTQRPLVKGLSQLPSAQGSTTVTPQPVKSATFRVASRDPWCRAIAAICASNWAIGRPAARRALTMST